MSKALVVAKWEYIERVKSKMFIISLFIFPIIIVAFAIVPSLLLTRTEDSQKVVGLVDPENKISLDVIEKIEERFTVRDGQPMYLIRKIDEPNADAETLRMIGNSLVFADDIVGYIYIPPDIYETNRFEYYSTNVGNLQDHNRFREVVSEILTGYRLEQRGIDPGLVGEIVQPVNLRTVRISPTGAERETGFFEIFWSSYIFLMAMMMLIATSGQILIRSVVEEKTNRIIEVLASSCSSNDLMIGKILGLTALGLTQIGLYALMGFAAVMFFGIEGSFENAWLLIPYFIIGYLFYAAIFVAVGSPLSSEQEAQQVTSWVVLVLMVPFIFALIAIENPDLTLMRILSFIPLFTPSFMALRFPIMMPSTFDIVATLGILIVSTIVMMWIAAKIFRIAILSYGKRPSLSEIFKWVKSG